MITEAEYNRIVGKLLVGATTTDDGMQLVEVLSTIEGLLDEADHDDYFGSEGWRHRLGWDE